MRTSLCLLISVATVFGFPYPFPIDRDIGFMVIPVENDCPATNMSLDLLHSKIRFSCKKGDGEVKCRYLVVGPTVGSTKDEARSTDGEDPEARRGDREEKCMELVPSMLKFGPKGLRGELSDFSRAENQSNTDFSFVATEKDRAERRNIVECRPEERMYQIMYDDLYVLCSALNISCHVYDPVEFLTLVDYMEKNTVLAAQKENTPKFVCPEFWIEKKEKTENEKAARPTALKTEEKTVEKKYPQKVTVEKSQDEEDKVVDKVESTKTEVEELKKPETVDVESGRKEEGKDQAEKPLVEKEEATESKVTETKPLVEAPEEEEKKPAKAEEKETVEKVREDENKVAEEPAAETEKVEEIVTTEKVPTETEARKEDKVVEDAPVETKKPEGRKSVERVPEKTETTKVEEVTTPVVITTPAAKPQPDSAKVNETEERKVEDRETVEPVEREVEENREDKKPVEEGTPEKPKSVNTDDSSREGELIGADNVSAALALEECLTDKKVIALLHSEVLNLCKTLEEGRPHDLLDCFTELGEHFSKKGILSDEKLEKIKEKLTNAKNGNIEPCVTKKELGFKL